MGHVSRRRHTAAMGPHPRQQSTQQLTNIICDGSTLLKLDFFLLLVILLLMHIASTLSSNDDDAATRRWAPCSPLDDITNSDSTLSLPTIYSTRAGMGGEGGRGMRTSNVVMTQEKIGTLGLWWQNNFFVWWLVRQWKSMVTIYDINMLID